MSIVAREKRGAERPGAGVSGGDAWRGFAGGNWQRRVDVREFIQLNYAPYEGPPGFLTGSSPRTAALWAKVRGLLAREREAGGVLDAETTVISSITSHAPGYLDRDLEVVVGLQAETPLKRALMPFGGLNIAEESLAAYGYELDASVRADFARLQRKTHNEGVFDSYDEESRRARRNHILTGLPDAYGRGRIIGDYRRVALYGVERLIAEKQRERAELEGRAATADVIQLREELTDQVRALEDLVAMAATYGFDVRRPAADAREAVQWLYLAYLAAVKEQNGAAMSLGRVSTFLDVFIQRDLDEGVLTEEGAQELMDQFVMKFRMVRFARTPGYNALFTGDPTWVTEAIGGMGMDGRPLVTRTSYRFLHTLRNLGPAPEPNLTVLWSPRLPEAFKEYCIRLSLETSSLQYENDELMRPRWGDDYGIACCVSAQRIGKQMQFFGARANLAKLLLYALNGGRDEVTGELAAPGVRGVAGEGQLEFDEVWANFDGAMEWLARVYINTMNTIHYMHDKYCYERLEMALHDRDVFRTLACGIAGLSVVADSLSAIKHARVFPVRDERGLIADFRIEGTWPAFGNDDARVDDLAVAVTESFTAKLRKHPAYRDAMPTLSVLTITSNVVYGKNTGSTPDGRKRGEPFAPGANPMHGRDVSGPWASLASVARLPYDAALDGISNTFTIVPTALGLTERDRVAHLMALLDGYMEAGGFHLNVNALTRETLVDAMEHPEKYPQLTIRVSGYAVNFIKLTREQQMEVISRTFHGSA